MAIEIPQLDMPVANSQEASMIDVIIPARNEQRTLASILARLVEHPFISRVIVCVDGNTHDITEHIADHYTEYVVSSKAGIRGKGQLIHEGMRMVHTPFVMLCDADYVGFRKEHIDAMAGNIPASTTLIGVPEYPQMNVPDRVISSWPWVSGIRIVPLEVIKSIPLHGYLTEVQINQATKRMDYQFRFRFLNRLISPYRITDIRLQEMERDRKWGIEHGILRLSKRALSGYSQRHVVDSMTMAHRGRKERCNNATRKQG